MIHCDIKENASFDLQKWELKQNFSTKIRTAKILQCNLVQMNNRLYKKMDIATLTPPTCFAPLL